MLSLNSMSALQKSVTSNQSNAPTTVGKSKASATTVTLQQASLPGAPHRKKNSSEHRQKSSRKDACASMLDCSSLKSASKAWNLPHNKFNYPHVPQDKL